MELGQLVLDSGALRSKVVRDLVGDRTIDIFTALSRKNEQGGQGGGIINFILNTGAKLLGSVLSFIFNSAGFLLAECFRWLAASGIVVYNFDWAQTDSSLKEQIDANNLAVVTSLGGLFGNATVWLGAIAIAGAATIKFPIVAGHVLIKLAEEGGEEVRSAFYGLFASIKNNLIENSFINGLLTVRRMKLLGQSPVTKQREPWTISGSIDKSIDDLKNPIVKAFLTGFKSQFEDSFFEALYVVAYGIEEGFAAAKAAGKVTTGKERMIELVPDKLVPDEKVILRGNEVALKPVIMNTLTNHALVKNREIGQFVGQPLPDYIRANPFVRKATVIFKSKEQPPYRRYGGTDPIKQVTYSIPDLKHNVTWAQLKIACKKFTWGKFRATANLSNARQMAVYGATASEAEDKLRELLKLSTAEILSLSITEEKDRHIKNRKTAVLVYPAYFHVTVRRNDLDDPQLVTLDGKGYTNFTQRVEIWRDTEPDDFEPIA